MVDRHFWRQHKKIEIKNTAPIFGEKTTQVSSQLSVWAGSKFIKKKREHGIDEWKWDDDHDDTPPPPQQ